MATLDHSTELGSVYSPRRRTLSARTVPLGIAALAALSLVAGFVIPGANDTSSSTKAAPIARRSAPDVTPPSAAYGNQVAAAMRTLNARRTAGRRTLMKAKSHAAQATAAHALANAYATATTAVTTAQPTAREREAGAALAHALQTTRSAYDDAAHFARGGKGGGYSAAVRAITWGESQVDDAVTQLRALGYR